MTKVLVLLSAGLVASTLLAQPGESSPAPAPEFWAVAQPAPASPAPACPCGSNCQCDELRSEIAALKVQLASMQVAKQSPAKEVALGGCANGACSVPQRASYGGCANGSCGSSGPVRRLFQARPRILGRWR